MDLTGWSLVIGAIASAIAVIVTSVTAAVVSILTFYRTGRMAEVSKATAAELAHVKDLVNSKSDQLNAAIKEAAFAKGEKSGAAEERERTVVADVASELGNGPKEK